MCFLWGTNWICIYYLDEISCFKKVYVFKFLDFLVGYLATLLVSRLHSDNCRCRCCSKILPVVPTQAKHKAVQSFSGKVKPNFTISYDMAPCSFVDIQRFRRMCCFNLQGKGRRLLRWSWTQYILPEAWRFCDVTSEKPVVVTLHCSPNLCSRNRRQYFKATTGAHSLSQVNSVRQGVCATSAVGPEQDKWTESPLVVNCNHFLWTSMMNALWAPIYTPREEGRQKKKEDAIDTSAFVFCSQEFKRWFPW
jgi:hypothetical protein